MEHHGPKRKRRERAPLWVERELERERRRRRIERKRTETTDDGRWTTNGRREHGKGEVTDAE